MKTPYTNFIKQIKKILTPKMSYLFIAENTSATTINDNEINFNDIYSFEYREQLTDNVIIDEHAQNLIWEQYFYSLEKALNIENKQFLFPNVAFISEDDNLSILFDKKNKLNEVQFMNAYYSLNEDHDLRYLVCQLYNHEKFAKEEHNEQEAILYLIKNWNRQYYNDKSIREEILTLAFYKYDHLPSNNIVESFTNYFEMLKTKTDNFDIIRPTIMTLCERNLKGEDLKKMVHFFPEAYQTFYKNSEQSYLEVNPYPICKFNINPVSFKKDFPLCTENSEMASAFQCVHLLKYSNVLHIKEAIITGLDNFSITLESNTIEPIDQSLFHSYLTSLIAVKFEYIWEGTSSQEKQTNMENYLLKYIDVLDLQYKTKDLVSNHVHTKKKI